MPTSNIKKVRNMLKDGRATIECHDPFTIRLSYEVEANNQPVECKEDTGYETFGISISSEKHEYVHAEYTLLTNEKKRRDTHRREVRRPRRSRKRYRKARFDNRKKTKGWLAPSLKNKADRHVDVIKRYASVCPIMVIIIEVGKFDTQALEAIEKGKPVPVGKDYQHGDRYGYDTLKAAMLERDGYACQVCGQTDMPLRMHHIGYWKKDRSNRLYNVMTICEECHTSANHAENGKLYGIEPITKGMPQPAFMNTVRWYIYEQVKMLGIETRITYGSVTKRERQNMNLPKTHANDAYSMGSFHPKHKAKPVYYQKKRRNNRVLEKFYDARYVDARDGKIKKAAELSTNRTNRSLPRNNPNNERVYRGKKVSKGRRSIRKRRYELQPGTVCMIDGETYTVKGCVSCGRYVRLDGYEKDVSTKKVKIKKYATGWQKTILL